MKSIGVAPRAIALSLSLALGLPDPAFALRMTQSVQSGLEEEIAQALGRSPSQPAAGLETRKIHLDPKALSRLSPQVRELLEQVVVPVLAGKAKFSQVNRVSRQLRKNLSKEHRFVLERFLLLGRQREVREAAKLLYDYLREDLNARILLPQGAVLKFGQDRVRLIPVEGYELWRLPQPDGSERLIPVVYPTAKSTRFPFSSEGWMLGGMAYVRIRPSWESMYATRFEELSHAADDFRIEIWKGIPKDRQELYARFRLRPDAPIRQAMDKAQGLLKRDPIRLTAETLYEIRAALRQLGRIDKDRVLFRHLLGLADFQGVPYGSRGHSKRPQKGYPRYRFKLRSLPHDLAGIWVNHQLVRALDEESEVGPDFYRKLWKENFTDFMDLKLQTIYPRRELLANAQLQRLAGLLQGTQRTGSDQAGLEEFTEEQIQDEAKVALRSLLAARMLREVRPPRETEPRRGPPILFQALWLGGLYPPMTEELRRELGIAEVTLEELRRLAQSAPVHLYTSTEPARGFEIPDAMERVKQALPHERVLELQQAPFILARYKLPSSTDPDLKESKEDDPVFPQKPWGALILLQKAFRSDILMIDYALAGQYSNAMVKAMDRYYGSYGSQLGWVPSLNRFDLELENRLIEFAVPATPDGEPFLFFVKPNELRRWPLFEPNVAGRDLLPERYTQDPELTRRLSQAVLEQYRAQASTAGLEEESGLLAYHRALADRINQDEIFRVELNKRGIIQNLIRRTPRFDGLFRIRLHLYGDTRYHSYENVRLLHYDPKTGLASMHSIAGEIELYNMKGDRVAWLYPGDGFQLPKGEWIRLRDAIVRGGGVSSVTIEKALPPKLEKYSRERLKRRLVELGVPGSRIPVPGTATLDLNSGAKVLIYVMSHNWAMDLVDPASGLEEWTGEKIEQAIKKLEQRNDPLEWALTADKVGEELFQQPLPVELTEQRLERLVTLLMEGAIHWHPNVWGMDGEQALTALSQVLPPRSELGQWLALRILVTILTHRGEESPPFSYSLFPALYAQGFYPEPVYERVKKDRDLKTLKWLTLEKKLGTGNIDQITATLFMPKVSLDFPMETLEALGFRAGFSNTNLEFPARDLGDLLGHLVTLGRNPFEPGHPWSPLNSRPESALQIWDGLTQGKLSLEVNEAPIPPARLYQPFPDQAIVSIRPMHAAAGLEEWIPEWVPVVKSFADMDPRAVGSIFLAETKPTVDQIERLLKSRRLEYALYGLVVRGIPDLALEVGSKYDLTAAAFFLTELYQKQEQVRLTLDVHNHPSLTAFPSHGDFKGIQGLDRLVAERHFLYAPRTGRLLEYGVWGFRPTKEPAEIRLRIWSEGMKEPQEFFMGRTTGWHLSNIREWRLPTGQRAIAQFYGALRRKGAVRVEIDDQQGYWVRWDRGVTLDSVLKTANLVQPAAGLEEGVPLAPDVTAGKVVFITPEMASPSLFESLKIFKPAPGKQLQLVVFAEHVFHAEEIEGWLNQAGLTALEIVNVQREIEQHIAEHPDWDLFDVVAAKQVEYYLGTGADIHTVWFFEDLKNLGRFLGVAPIHIQLWEKSLERQFGAQA